MTGFLPDHIRAEVRASPNFGPRRDVSRASMLVLHYTGMPTGELAESWLCNPASEVSSHYIVHEDGRIVQMVREADRAWHAGKSSWHGRTDINSLSVGIEIVNPGNLAEHPPFSAVQIEAVIDLCRDICARLSILPDMVLAHSDIAPGRKIDPGPAFPWEQLADAGVGRMPVMGDWPDVDPIAEGDAGLHVERLQSMLQMCGYGIEITGLFDPFMRQVVQSFQLHYRRSLADGVADAQTQALVAALVPQRTA
ncbi:MAG: N-acetylmuramoyl-L-alanine amidase [Mesorhizobium sp.]